MSNEYLDIMAKFTTTDDASICSLEIRRMDPKMGEELECRPFTGTSKRDPTDKPNQATAENLALARALKSAGSYFSSLAGNAVLAADKKREHQERIIEIAKEKKRNRDFYLWLDSIQKMGAPVFPSREDLDGNEPQIAEVDATT